MTSRRPRAERWALIGGSALTASGIAHLVAPSAFESVNRMAFKSRIRTHVLINGGIETGLGLALLSSRTRRAATAIAIVYLTYFNANLAHRQRVLRS